MSQIIQGISDKITDHAVEEEARLMRIIMHKTKKNLLNLSRLCKNTIG